MAEGPRGPLADQQQQQPLDDNNEGIDSAPPVALKSVRNGSLIPLLWLLHVHVFTMSYMNFYMDFFTTFSLFSIIISPLPLHQVFN